MRHLLHSHFILTCLALTVTLPLAAQFEASAVIQYTAEEVGLSFTPTAMNNRRWIVGYSSPPRPMRYRPGVGVEQISEHPGRLWDINDAGTAVGELSVNGDCQEAIVRPAGAPWKRIGRLGGICSEAYAINEAGKVAGGAYILGTGDRPFIYTEAEGMKMLFDQRAIARGINEAGQITGGFSVVSGSPSGFLWDPVQGLTGINTGSILETFVALGIADNGTVAGYYNRRASNDNLATFSLSGGLRILGQSRVFIFPNAVNDRGWIVGRATFGSLERAFLYVYGHGVKDLNLLVNPPLDRLLDAAFDINDRDEILVRTRPSAAFPSRYYILKRVRE